MERSKINESQWLSYKTTAQDVEKTGQYQPLIDWYDQNCKAFEGGTYAAKKCSEILYKYIRNDSNLAILDLGCGTGDQSYILNEMDVQALFYGIDMSAGMLELARSKGLYIELKQSILPEIPYPDNTFDFVISAGTLCSPGNGPPQSLPEAIRVTKPAGMLCFSYRKHWFETEESGWKKVHEEMLEIGLMKQLSSEVDDYNTIKKDEQFSGLYFVVQKL